MKLGKRNNQDLNRKLGTSFTQVTEVGGCSNRMEKAELIKVLEKVRGKQLKTKSLTTDRHCQIKKYMRGEEEDTYHQFHIWHFCKSVQVKLLNAAKKKACEDFKPWIKSMCNHFWNEILLKKNGQV